MKNLKTIFCYAIVLLVSNFSNATEINKKEAVISKKSESADICSITYIVRESIGGTVVVSEYTLTASTCEQVESAAIAAGIIKAKKSLSAN
ncbi:hypothetical protein [Flavobacterium sp.]|jgi:hypothetical protein|uniref:hypothetical protein n=1 Tax=Flavobacterium sp. TaxID=239 RepID=UPI00391CA54F